MRLSQHQTGSMLLSVLFLILLLSVFMAGMVMLSSQSSQQLVYEVQSLKARLTAESILEKQVYALLSPGAEEEIKKVDDITINNCQATVEHGELRQSDGDELRQIEVIAIGTCKQGAFTVKRNIAVEVIVEGSNDE